MEPGHLPAWMVATGAMLVPGIYLFRLHKVLLLEGISAIVVRWLFAATAIVGLAIAARRRDRFGFELAIALGSPLAHCVAFLIAFRLFVRVIGREPMDVYKTSKPGLAPDRVFFILVFLGLMFATIATTWGIAKRSDPANSAVQPTRTCGPRG